MVSYEKNGKGKKKRNIKKGKRLDKKRIILALLCLILSFVVIFKINERFHGYVVRAYAYVEKITENMEQSAIGEPAEKVEKEAGEYENGGAENELGDVETETGETESGEGETEIIETESETETYEEPTVDKEEYVILNDIFKVKKDNMELVEVLSGLEDKNIKSVTVPNSIKIIGERAFEGHKYIEEVLFEEGSKLKTVNDYAFNYCISLKTITLPEKVTKVGQYSFMNCESLTSISLPEGLKTLSYRVFEGCSLLTELDIPSTVNKGTEVLGRNCGVTTVKFLKGRTYIPANILRNCSTVKKVIMSRGVTVIRKNAFYGCIALSKITAPTTLKKININAFRDCQSLKKYNIRPMVYYIGPGAFRDCSNLAFLTLRKHVTSIGNNAFAGASKLTLLVWANSKQRIYAINNKLKWDYSDAEKERRSLSLLSRSKLLSISVGDKSDFKLKKLKNYVPQGVSTVGNYVVVSAYREGHVGRSILLVYNKKGKYIKYAYIPNADHTGSVACVKGKLVVSLNNVSALDYIGVISPEKIKKVKNGKCLSYDYKVKLSSHADFTDYDGTYFWAGRSIDSEGCIMCGYKVSMKKVKVTKHKKEKRLHFTKVYSYRVPANTQGVVVVKKSKYKRQFIFTQSYGVTPDSKIIVYNVNLRKDKSLGKSSATYRAPSMLEGIAKKGNYIYMVFESACGKYTRDMLHQTDVRVKRVLKVKYKKLNKLLKYE